MHVTQRIVAVYFLKKIAFIFIPRLVVNYSNRGCLDNMCNSLYTRVGTLIVATNYLQLTQNRYMFRSFTVLQCSHQHCVQPVASDVEVVGYL